MWQGRGVGSRKHPVASNLLPQRDCHVTWQSVPCGRTFQGGACLPGDRSPGQLLNERDVKRNRNLPALCGLSHCAARRVAKSGCPMKCVKYEMRPVRCTGH